MRAPAKEGKGGGRQEEVEEGVQWEGEEPIQEREVGGEEEMYPQGCWRMPRIAGQVLKIPASFPRASSLPRRLRRSVTPSRQPVKEAEVEAESAGGAVHAERSRLPVRGSNKRAASTSPTRGRSLRERLPRQIRSFINARVGSASRAPPKPSRRAGPIGRSWVKVYDDITYMDDASEEYSPVVGYSGAPVKIPDAEPLPRPPTPPPPARQRSPSKRTPATPTPSLKSEYDNVPADEPSFEESDRLAKKQRLSDEELILLELTNQQHKLKDLSETSEKQSISDRELILRELATKEANEAAILKPNEEPEKPPTRRSRENSRFKRRQKRSGTPIALDRLSNSQEGDLDAFQGVEYTNGVASMQQEDDYIIPEKTSLPSRPPRGNKIYETVLSPKESDSQTNEPTVTASSEVTQIEVKQENKPAEPARPVRGIKVYESILIENKSPTNVSCDTKNTESEQIQVAATSEHEIEIQEVKSESNETVEQQTAVEEPTIECSKVAENQTQPDVMNTQTEEQNDVNVTETEVPEKPKRGIKVYEDILIGKKEYAADQIIPESTSEKLPAKPKRGIKLYEDVLPKATPENENKENEPPAQTIESSVTSASAPPPSKPARGNKIYSAINFTSDENTNTEVQILNIINNEKNKKIADVEPKTSEDSKEIDNSPPYAKVQKTRDSQMIDVSNIDSEGVPPPVPPKKRGRQPVTSTEVPPPRPERHLKPRARSSEATTRVKRQKVGESEAKIPPQKPVRNSADKACTLPRRKKNQDTVIARMSIEAGKAPEVTLISPDTDSYENVELQDHKISYRTRPLPPTPVSICSNTAVTNESKCDLDDNSLSNTLPSTLADGTTAVGANVSLTVNEKNESEQNTCVSTADSSVEGGGVCDPSSRLDANTSASTGGQGLEEAIDNNLKNIESSFATLDSVLKSLKNYSTDDNISVGISPSSVSNDCLKQTNECTSEDVSEQPSTTGDQLVLTNIEASIKFDPNQNDTEISVDVINKISDSSISEVCSTNVPTDSSACVVKKDEESTSGETEDNQEQKTRPPTHEVEVSDAEHETVQMLADTCVVPSKIEETTEILGDTCVVSALVKEEENTAVSTEIIRPVPRKLSVAAENVTADTGGSFTLAESLPSDELTTSVAKVDESHSSSDGENRKISVAAETVVLEFMPETTCSLQENSSPAETASVVKLDEAAAVSVAAVSVTQGEFADTVINNTENLTSPTIAVESIETGELAEAKQTSTTSIDVKCENILQGEGNTDGVQQNDTKLTPASELLVETLPSGSDDTVEASQDSACNSLEGSVTSITDDESVVSVVTKEELEERKNETSSTSEVKKDMSTTDSNILTSQENNKTEDSSTKSGEPLIENSEANSSPDSLEEGVAGINSRLEDHPVSPKRAAVEEAEEEPCSGVDAGLSDASTSGRQVSAVSANDDVECRTPSTVSEVLLSLQREAPASNDGHITEHHQNTFSAGVLPSRLPLHNNTACIFYPTATLVLLLFSTLIYFYQPLLTFYTHSFAR